MKMLERFIERITNRRATEEEIRQLKKEIDYLQRQNAELIADYTKSKAPLQKHIQNLLEEVAQLKQFVKSGVVERLNVLENDRDGLFDRIDQLREALEKTNAELADTKRIEVLEKDRTELFQRQDQDRNEFNSRTEVLEEDRNNIFQRIDQIERRLRACGLLNLNTRLDSRIIRLEILWYYREPARRATLDEEQLKILDYLENSFDYERNAGRTYPEDWKYEAKNCKPSQLPYDVKEDDGLWYADLNGKRLYLGENERDVKEYLTETVYWLEGDTPHRYLDPLSDGIDIQEGSILLDIGAAEGYFGIRHLDKCKKVYFFEYDEKWLQYLRKTCEPFGEKVEIIEGRVGDREGEIHIDDFFEGREKPTHIKMDVEGAEGSVLRGMSKLLRGDDPLTLLVCTYHRQEDQIRYNNLLKDNFEISFSKGYYWDMQDPYPPFFRRGILRAVKKLPQKD